jgi:hypothetical protein
VGEKKESGGRLNETKKKQLPFKVTEARGQCHKTFYGRNCIGIGVTRSKYAASGVITAVKSLKYWPQGLMAQKIYICNLRIFVISSSVCPWQAFLA